MSQWLKSVNNLLDNIDGQAGTLQENAVVMRGRDVLQNVLGRKEAEHFDDDDSDDDDDEYYEDDEDCSNDDDNEEEGGKEEGDHRYEDDDVLDDDQVMTLQDVLPVERVREKLMAQAPESVQEDSDKSYDDVGEDSDIQRQMQQTTDSDSSPDTVKVEPPTSIEQHRHPQLKAPSLSPTLVAASESTEKALTVPPQPPVEVSVEVPETKDNESSTENEAIQPQSSAFQQESDPDNSSPKLVVPISSAVASAKVVRPTPLPPKRQIGTPTPPSSAPPPLSDIQLSKALKKSRAEVKKLQQDAKSWKQKVIDLQAELQDAQAEMEAQQKELQSAAAQMQKERDEMKEEREEFLDEQEDELEQQKEHYEGLIQAHRKQHAQEKAELEGRLKNMEAIRKQEGGDYTAELEESLEREREALRKLNEVTSDKDEMQQTLMKMEEEGEALQSKLESALESVEAATSREQQAEEKLDAAVALNARKLSQSKTRESELQRTIAELSAALTQEQQRSRKAEQALTMSTSMSDSAVTKDDSVSKEDLRMAHEELQSAQAQVQLERQRCEMMRQELQDLTKEQAKEASATQARQREQDLEMQVLRSTISRLQASLRRQEEVIPLSSSTSSSSENDNIDPEQVARLLKENGNSKKQVQNLSEQLVRHQEQAQRNKSELLALQGRLQSEKLRADGAEQALEASSFTTDSRSNPTLQTGLRRRVKGGSRSAGIRSIRSALDMGPGRVAQGMEPIAQTIDGIDSFMVETGSFMKQEPLARLLFLFYICILHLWSFCLVIFHAHSYEVIHGDLGNLSEAGGEFAPPGADVASMAAASLRAATSARASNQP